MPLFGAKLPIDEDELDFQLATLKWLAGEFGPITADTPLVTPTNAYFTGKRPRSHGEVESLFDEVKGAAGMADWACKLEPGDAALPLDGGNALLIQHEGAPPPCGTFEVAEASGERRIVITYNPSMTADAEGLIATFAHELGHYLLATADSPPPGGWELQELHTDLAAVYLGFGLFMANNAKNFRAFSTGSGSGWEASVRGYLSESALVTALVIVERLAGRDPVAAEPFLKKYLRKDLKRAASALARRFPDQTGAVEAADLDAFN